MSDDTIVSIAPTPTTEAPMPDEVVKYAAMALASEAADLAEKLFIEHYDGYEGDEGLDAAVEHAHAAAYKFIKRCTETRIETWEKLVRDADAAGRVRVQ